MISRDFCQIFSWCILWKERLRNFVKGWMSYWNFRTKTLYMYIVVIVLKFTPIYVKIHFPTNVRYLILALQMIPERCISWHVIVCIINSDMKIKFRGHFSCRVVVCLVWQYSAKMFNVFLPTKTLFWNKLITFVLII